MPNGDHLCEHILKRGPHKGQPCNKNVSRYFENAKHCTKHILSYTREEFIIIMDYMDNAIAHNSIIEAEPQKKQCSYVFKKGKNKGKQCSTKTTNCFCSRHHKNLPLQFLIKPTNKTKKDFPEENNCSVCYEENSTFTKCKHNLCGACLIQLRKQECPMCRQELVCV
jgi:hypothetical protein